MKDLFTIAPLTDVMRDALAPAFRVHHVHDMDDPVAWLSGNGAGIEYVLTDGHYGLAPEYLAGLPDLKLVSSNGVGYDAIDTDAMLARGVLVTHTPSVLNAEVATTALMLLIACYRNFPAEVAQAQTGAWEAKGNLPLARSADGRTIAILGLGRIGMAIAEKLAPFEAKILYSARSKKDVPFKFYSDLKEMAEDADALIAITPGGAETHHLIDAEVMRALGPAGVLINVGRGSVVDETALIAALQAGELGGAGLDVFENEPHIPPALREMSNVVLTPHIGSATVETRAAMGKLAVDNLLSHLKDGIVITPVPEVQSLL
jgi:lactate dehydrogenase-like 2-hydroxyacid dehydrogenase